MRHQDLNSSEAALRPKAARIAEAGPGPAQQQSALVLGPATAEDRPDVLGAAGILDLQRAVGNSAVSTMLQRDGDDDAASPVHSVISSGGHALEPGVRKDMESRLGQDFGDVRVHQDGAAHDSAAAVNAHAYTVGSNVVFQHDKYNPSSPEGRVMLAHELTHVMQQRSGPVDGTPAPGGVSVSDPSDRFEREAVANAEHVAGSSAPAPAVQRDAAESAGQEEEADAVQGTFVQRATDDEELEESG